MPSCGVISCKNYKCAGGSSSILSFFRIPKMTKDDGQLSTRLQMKNRQALAWIRSLNRKDITDNTRVCSVHFTNGYPAKEVDFKHEDWCPHINMGHDMNAAQETVTLRTNNLSDEQTMILHRFMDEHPKLKQSKFSPNFTHESAIVLWKRISAKLNSVPGARKIWSQWRRTWQELTSNLRKSEPRVCTTEKVVRDTVFSEILRDTDNSKDGTANLRVKRHRAKNMSTMQKRLLCKLVKSNDKINVPDIGSFDTFNVKKEEWKRIAEKLNSTVGSRKTWSQWKKCSYDLRKYYIHNDREIETALYSSDDEDSEETANCRTDNIVSAAQLNCMVKEMSQRPEAETMLPYIWLSLCMQLNKLGPSSKSTVEWRKVWTNHKSKVTELVDRYGFDKCNHLQQRTYKIIQESDRDLNGPVATTLTENRLQIPNDIAECNITGSLVAVKLRSMRMEQKLIAEKLISKILFQGQMEMFQYSDGLVSIPGYT